MFFVNNTLELCNNSGIVVKYINLVAKCMHLKAEVPFIRFDVVKGSDLSVLVGLEGRLSLRKPGRMNGVKTPKGKYGNKTSPWRGFA
jgi:hypothetical protein